MKSAFTYGVLTMMFCVMLADAVYVTYVQNEVIKACVRRIAYDKSGDMTCPQEAVKHAR